MSRHKNAINISVTHHDVVREAEQAYPLTPKLDAIWTRWMYYNEVIDKKKGQDAYFERIRFKLLCLFIVPEERDN